MKRDLARVYYGYHKHRRMVGPVSYDKMMEWRQVVKLKWKWRAKKYD